jgi:hypothetical protein
MVGPVATMAMLLVLPTASAAAQSGAGIDPRFQPWIGCWRTMDGGVGLEELDGDKQPTRACIVPSSTTLGTVDIALFHRDSLMSRITVPVPGTTLSRKVDECVGDETSMWTADDTRLIMRADLSCSRGVKRVETGMMSMNAAGQWVQFQHLAVGKNEATTVARFRFEGDSALPAGLAAGSMRSTRALRLSTGAPISSDAVMSVATAVPPSLAEAWLAELGQQFALDGKTLIRMADRGVPSRVIDVMVALANPERFQLGPSVVNPQGAGLGPDILASRDGSRRRAGMSRCDMMDDFCYGPGGMGAWGLGYRYGMFDPWGWGFNSPYGGNWGFNNGLNYGFGFNQFSPWGTRWGNGVYYGGGPVVIIPNPGSGGGGGGVPTVRGRAVNGGGYTRANPYSGPTSGGSAFPPSPSSGSSGGSSGSAGGAASGSADGGGRTAKPRPPGGR